MKTYVKLLLVGLTAILLYLSLAYWDIPIQYEDDCIEFNLNSNEFNNIKISINGSIRKSLIRKDMVRLNMTIGEKNIPDLSKHPKVFPFSYNGTVLINGEPVFKSVDYMEQELKKINSFYMAKIEYDYFVSSPNYEGRKTLYIGTVYFDTNFDKMFIALSEKKSETSYSWSSKDGRVIVPETNIGDAIELIESLTGSKIR